MHMELGQIVCENYRNSNNISSICRDKARDGCGRAFVLLEMFENKLMF